VLHKPSRLTPEEYEHVKQHVRIGLEILAPLKHLGQALEFMHDHHEHLDGSGYPRGLSGDRISIGGRILAAADAFDALTSRRAYRESLTPQATLERMAEFVGRHFDPIVFDALRTVIERRKSLTFIDDAAG
jgi:putative two-component system response regulator